jgi:hypothetical protein
MNYGTIKRVARVYRGDWPALRLMVMTSNNDWTYLYIPATNYKFGCNIVSWNDKTLFWHAEQRTVQFDLLREEVTI